MEEEEDVVLEKVPSQKTAEEHTHRRVSQDASVITDHAPQSKGTLLLNKVRTKSPNLRIVSLVPAPHLTLC